MPRIAKGTKEDTRPGVTQIALRLDDPLFRRVRERAMANRRSFNAEVAAIVAERVAAKERQR